MCLLFLNRVRIEVLKALANRVSNSQLLTYAVYNGPRPKLSVGPAAGFPGRRQALFYTEAIKQYGHLLEENLLDKAYDRAGMFFTGKSQCVFHACSLFVYFHGLYCSYRGPGAPILSATRESGRKTS